MDVFYKTVMTFLDLFIFGHLDFLLKDRNLSGFTKNILI